MLSHFHAIDLVRYARKHGGFTYNAKPDTRQQLLQGDGGFVVSVGHCECRLSSSYTDEQIACFVVAFSRANERALLNTDSNLYLGCWIDGGYVYLDVSERIENEIDAVAACLLRCELAYFDVNKQVSVNVDEIDAVEQTGHIIHSRNWTVDEILAREG